MRVLGHFCLILALLCLLSTLGFYWVLGGDIPFTQWGLLFSLLFFVASLVFHMKSLIAFIKSESLKFYLKSIIYISLTTFVLSAVNYIVSRQVSSVDLTENKIHSLSELTQALIQAVPQPLEVYYFHAGNQKVRGYEPIVRSFLQPYLALNKKMNLQSHSIFKRPDLAKEFNAGGEESALFIKYKGRIERVSELSEPAMTNALLKLTKPAKIIYFLQGHGERLIENTTTFGLSGLKQQLERLHYQVKPLEPSQQWPKDMAMLIMAGPRQPMTEAFLNQVSQYIQSGGAVFIAADPGESHQLNNFLQGFGVQLNEDYIYSQQKTANQSPWMVRTHKGQSQHEVSRSLEAGVNPTFFIASSIDILSAASQFMVSPILEHLPSNLNKIDLIEDSANSDKKSLVAAVVIKGQGEKPYRLAVVGDSDFLTNQFYVSPGNFDLIISLVTYLSKDEDLLKLRPATSKNTTLILTDVQYKMYILFFIFPTALLFFVLALFFRLRRAF